MKKISDKMMSGNSCALFEIYLLVSVSSFITVAQEKKIYIGILPKYTWNDSNLYEYKTEADANQVILSFMFKYFDIEMSEEEFTKEIGYIETCGWE